MVKIGDVWDRTVDVINGRASILASIALLLSFLPNVARDAINLAVAAGSVATALKIVLVVALLLLTLWGSLSLIAVASDPATDRANALRAGRVTLPSAILAVAVLAFVFGVLFAPGFFLLARSGFDFAAAANNLPQTHLVPGTFGGFTLYVILYGIAMLWAGARLSLLYPVLVNERLGLRAIARSFELTRGLTWKIVGVLILYGIVLLVIFAAATSVSGLIFRLIMGSEGSALVAFLSATVGAVVTTIFAALQSVFTAQLYLAARATRGEATTPA